MSLPGLRLPNKPVRTLVLDEGSLDHAPGSASSGVSAITMSASGSPGAGVRGGGFGAALSRAGRVLSGVGGNLALHGSLSVGNAAGSPSESEGATTLPDSGGVGAANLGVELGIASLKEFMASSVERQEAVVARQAAENERFRADLGDVRPAYAETSHKLGPFRSDRTLDALVLIGHLALQTLRLLTHLSLRRRDLTIRLLSLFDITLKTPQRRKRRIGRQIGTAETINHV